MNNKIRDLCMQAILDVDGIDNPDTQMMFIPDCFRDRFAELIIEECRKVCREQRNPGNLNYKPSESFAEAIRMHFL